MYIVFDTCRSSSSALRTALSAALSTALSATLSTVLRTCEVLSALDVDWESCCSLSPGQTHFFVPTPPGGFFKTSEVSALVFRRYSYENAPIQKELAALEVGRTAAFMVSPLASAITGHVLYVDNGLNVMGLAPDSKALVHEDK